MTKASLKFEFIANMLALDVLRFGDFTLKSGRKSPYFFNAGLFHQGACLQRLGQYYADTILASDVEFDVLFGPAYKGIPLATTTAIALAHKGKNVDVSFNRKEVKSHGEQGMLIGAGLEQKKVLIIDDVITGGTAFREAQKIITDAQGLITGVVIALDRQERGENSLSAIDEIEKEHAIDVLSIITLDDIKQYLSQHNEHAKLKLIEKHQALYGVSE